MKTVLLAYERDQDLAAIETLLNARGHRVLKARNGLDALEVARQDTPHVIVSDVLLPRLDGFALCRRLKEDPILQHLPVFLLSFRVEGPKYEAFAAEVGAERFFARGSTLEDLAGAIDEQRTGSGTMRMPALVPELLERREQDRRRQVDLERQLRDLEVANRQLEVAERVAREHAENEARQRVDHAAADATTIRDLQARQRELEERLQQLAEVESQARGAVEEIRAEKARAGVLEARLSDLQASRAAAQSAAVDAARTFVALPVPAWLADLETHELYAVSAAAAALFRLSVEQLPGRSIAEILPVVWPEHDAVGPIEVDFERQDGAGVVLELRRQPVSYAGRACWLTTARDVTNEKSAGAARQVDAERARLLDESPLALCLAEPDGRLGYANAVFLRLVGHPADGATGLTLQQFEDLAGGDATVRNMVVGGGPVTRQARWRRRDGTWFDVEVEAGAAEAATGRRLVAVRDVTGHVRGADRAERARLGLAGVLELTQQAHTLTESEIHARSLQLLQRLTGSAAGYVFLSLPDTSQLELAGRSDGEQSAPNIAVLTRWRGSAPANSALLECLNSKRVVAREGEESSGDLRQAGLPASLRRQLATPILDGGRLAGVLLLADKAEPYDDDDRQHAAQVGDGLWKLLRRRRSDAEIVSAMDHMERVMLGTIEALAVLSECQDACKDGRARRVADLASGIGSTLGLPGHAVRGLRVMGQLLDVGMLQIPREILWRPGPLSAAEFELLRTHAERGHDSLKRIEFPWPVAEAVRQHHERLDGSGYPRGLKGDDILLEARILAVADAIEAMLSPRPHRSALTLVACIEELQSQAGRRYDARVVKACVKLLREREARTAGESTGQRIA